jgi:hypothetical protein
MVTKGERNMLEVYNGYNKFVCFHLRLLVASHSEASVYDPELFKNDDYAL